MSDYNLKPVNWCPENYEIFHEIDIIYEHLWLKKLEWTFDDILVPVFVKFDVGLMSY